MGTRVPSHSGKSEVTKSSATEPSAGASLADLRASLPTAPTLEAAEAIEARIALLEAPVEGNGKKAHPYDLPAAMKRLRDGEDLAAVVKSMAPFILSGDLATDVARSALAAASGRMDGEAVFDSVLAEAKAIPTEIPRMQSKTPLDSAETFVNVAHRRGDVRLMHHYLQGFLRWDGAAYRPRSEDEVRADIWGFLPKGGVNPTSGRVSNVVDALRGLCQLSDIIQPGTWLGGQPEEYPPAEELIALQSGLFHPPTKQVLPSSPRLFNMNALPFDFDPNDERDPVEWFKFLASVWEDDAASVECLQEVMGYLLTADNRFHKMFLLIGPPRSGKGTIARVITDLLGEENVAAPTLTDFASEFGLSALLGKTCAIIADAHTSGRVDAIHTQIVNRLKSISGSDRLTVNRKGRELLHVRLKTRIVMMANELPRLFDDSSALAKRFVPLHMRKSFLGHEDLELQDRLTPELPRILHWALLGRARLYKRGHFKIPESARTLARELEEESAPIKAFLRDRCTVGPGLSISSVRLYAIWKLWCEERGKREGTMDWLARALRAAVPGVESKRSRGRGKDGPKMVTVYTGLGEYVEGEGE